MKGKLVLETEKARQSYGLMKAKALRGMSIGYDTIRSSMKDGARQLHEVKLYEVSFRRRFQRMPKRRLLPSRIRVMLSRSFAE